jgi:Xaa-Pro dipeptidase
MHVFRLFADMTRTVSVGRGDGRFEELYGKVLQAQERAIKASEVGVSAGAIDLAARSYLKSENLARYFNTRTGHGLGIEVHEQPYLQPNERRRLQRSTVCTIEPGVYIPGRLGIRIEDEIFIARGETRIITERAPKEFGWWL